MIKPYSASFWAARCTYNPRRTYPTYNIPVRRSSIAVILLLHWTAGIAAPAGDPRAAARRATSSKDRVQNWRLKPDEAGQ